MTENNLTDPGEGERAEAQRRKTFWTGLGVIMVGGTVTGLLTGISAAHNDYKADAIWTDVPQPFAIALIAASLIAFLYGSWRFFRAIDEVELVDNLWASTAAYYAYATLFPLWWVLAKIGVLPAPNDWAIYLIALGGGGAIYLWRKWRAR